MEELVLAFPTTELWSLLTYKEKGFIEGSSDVLKAIVSRGQFLRRSELEEDPSFKQIIPYGVISFSDSYYLFRRGHGQREKRLQDLHSLGVGGHMNPGKNASSAEQYIRDELKRELFEEVRFSEGCTIKDIEFIGFINDDTIPVGRHHIGLLYHIRVSGREIYINESDKMSGEWVEKHCMPEFFERMESWSRVAFKSLIKVLPD